MNRRSERSVFVATISKDNSVCVEGGNITSHAEANIHCDPEAADVVFAADWPVTLVPLDVTTRHRFTEADIAALAAAPSAGVRSVAEMLVSYAGFYSTIYGERVALLHDPLAAAIAVGGVSVTESIAVPVAVNVSDGELQGRTSRYAALAGETAVSRRAATVVLDVDVPLAPVLVEALTRQ